MYVFVAFLVSDAYFHIVNASPTDILSAEKHYVISIRVNKVEGVSNLCTLHGIQSTLLSVNFCELLR